MLKVIFEVPECSSIKEKRRVVKSMLGKLQNRYQLTAAEVDMQDSLGFCQIGCALVSNSKTHGETVLQKGFSMIENEFSVRIQDMSIYSEEF